LARRASPDASTRVPILAFTSSLAPETLTVMIELIRTNDPVVISFAEALLRDAGIAYLVADQNMSIIEGSIGILPKRLLVDGEAEDRARRLLTDAGIAHEMRQ
jgi:hypothetical protein